MTGRRPPALPQRPLCQPSASGEGNTHAAATGVMRDQRIVNAHDLVQRTNYVSYLPGTCAWHTPTHRGQVL